MASLSEMLAYAEAQAPRNPVAQTLTSAAGGILPGFQAGQKRKDNQLNQVSKLLEIEAKMKEMKMQENMAKYFGFIPYDENELEAAREVAFETLGNKDPSKTRDKSRAGALQKFYNPETEDLTKTFSSSGGFTVSSRPKKSTSLTPAGIRAERSAIESLAVKFAERSQVRELKNQGRRDEEIGMLMFGWKPTQSEVQKFYRIAEEYYKGDRQSFEDLFDKANRDDDPQGLFDEEDQ